MTTGNDLLAPPAPTTPTSETDSLRQQLLQAQRLSSVGELASSVAHEFNNVIATIINYAKIGLKGRPQPLRRKHSRRSSAAGKERRRW